MEVISAGTRRLDEVTKVREYAEAGIREYWLVDPELETVTVHVLAGSSFERRARGGKGDLVRSEIVAGFEINVDELLSAK